MPTLEIRFLLLWIALEALFGTDGGELTFQLAQRVAFFVADGPDEARELFTQMKKSYRQRSNAVHGSSRPKDRIAQDDVRTIETIARRAVARLLLDDGVRDHFLNESRRTPYLNELIFERFREWQGAPAAADGNV